MNAQSRHRVGQTISGTIVPLHLLTL